MVRWTIDGSMIKMLFLLLMLVLRNKKKRTKINNNKKHTINVKKFEKLQQKRQESINFSPARCSLSSSFTNLPHKLGETKQKRTTIDGIKISHPSKKKKKHFLSLFSSFGMRSSLGVSILLNLDCFWPMLQG